MNKILILGAGELGTAIIEALLRHPVYNAKTTPIALLIRSTTILNPSRDRKEQLEGFRRNGVALIAGDLDKDSREHLVSTFSKYDTVIHAGGMTNATGVQLKVTQAAIDARVKTYVPWQMGVDYDIIGKDGGMGLFSEQCDVRSLLRSQSNTHWFIISCGIFMSFLFEPFWGVIGRHEETGEIEVVRALGGWDHVLTVTTVEDIAKCTAELLLVDTNLRDKAVYIAGDSLVYEEFANVVEKVYGKRVKRELWDTSMLKKEVDKNPENKLLKYRVVFSEGQGLSWEKQDTYNAGKGIEMEDCASWFNRSLAR